MYAKQYEITLPADYDMEIIRKRVAEGGHVLDDRAGLGLSALIEREAEQLQRLCGHEGVHTAALAVDPHHWQLMRFLLWADSSAPDGEATERYEVLHLSAPGLGDLPEGRGW